MCGWAWRRAWGSVWGWLQHNSNGAEEDARVAPPMPLPLRPQAEPRRRQAGLGVLGPPQHGQCSLYVLLLQGLGLLWLFLSGGLFSFCAAWRGWRGAGPYCYCREHGQPTRARVAFTPLLHLMLLLPAALG